MKKLWFMLPLLAMVFLNSCNDDEGYSLGDYWLASATFMADSNYYYIQTDAGKALFPSATNIPANKHEDGNRILVSYTILQDAPAESKYDYLVKINGTSDILTKGIFSFTAETTQEVKDSIGHNAVTIRDTWFTNDFLNVEFEYGGGSRIHYISLVKDETEALTDDGAVILELKHNTNGDPYNYLQWGIASFDISELQQEGQDSISIFVRALGKNQEYQYNKVLRYDYGKNNTQSQAPAKLSGEVSSEMELE